MGLQRIRVTFAGVVYRDHEAIDLEELDRDRGTEIGRAGGGPALVVSGFPRTPSLAPYRGSRHI